MSKWLECSMLFSQNKILFHKPIIWLMQSTGHMTFNQNNETYLAVFKFSAVLKTLVYKIQ